MINSILIIFVNGTRLETHHVTDENLPVKEHMESMMVDSVSYPSAQFPLRKGEGTTAARIFPFSETAKINVISPLAHFGGSSHNRLKLHQNNLVLSV